MKGHSCRRLQNVITHISVTLSLITQQNFHLASPIFNFETQATERVQ